MRIYLLIAVTILAASCVRTNNQSGQEPISQEKVFEVSEVVQATGYTYLKVKENSDEKWVAVTHQEVQPGDVFYYDEALQMTNFHSKDLDRTFEVIYFINQISKTPVNQTMQNNPHGHAGRVDAQQKSTISLAKNEDEITVAGIYSQPDDFSGKEVTIRGVVVKVNRGIMGKNWIHIQDGTASNGKFDLTVTTQDIAEVNDEVTFKGVIATNKDFGSGYYYEVIMEDAVLTTNATAALLK